MTAADQVIALPHRVRRLVGFRDRARQDASEALFRGIRRRLILWYSGVLAAALLLSGIALYVSVRQNLLAPVQEGLQANAQALSDSWRTTPIPLPGLSPDCPHHMVPHVSLYVCFDVHGRIIGGSDLAPFFPGFDQPTLVGMALARGRAGDTVQESDQSATIQRYALKVSAPSGRGTLGVVQVGASIGPQLQALDTLLHLLFILGGLTLLFAAIAGLFLANRALLPARLAYARQRNFIADASHELRTPLTMLRSNVEVVLRGRNKLPPDDVALLEDTVMEATHLASLANNMLDLARLDAEEAHLEQEVIDLGQLANEAVRWATSLAADQGLMIRAEHSDPVLVVGDRALLEQVALILIENGIKYNKSGGEVVVRAWMDGRWAYLAVRDTGIGIEAEHLTRLGERFYRVDKARSRASGGAGLGISIVRRIAASHGGSFHLTSEPGQGTTATLSLPAAGHGSTTT